MQALPDLVAQHAGAGASQVSRAAPGEAPRSVADIGAFITMLSAACASPEVNERLERLLSMPDEERKGLVHAWVTDLLVAEAPRDFVQAVMAVGNPLTSGKPELDATIRSFSPCTVFFDDRGRVTKVTGNEETLAKVYAE